MIKRIVAVTILICFTVIPSIGYFYLPGKYEVNIDNEIYSVQERIMQERINIEETEIGYVEKYTNKESELLMNDGRVLSIIPINTLLCVEETNNDYSTVILDDNMEAKIRTDNLSLNKTELTSYDVPDIDATFKSYTDYRKITNIKSKQYQIVQNSYTDCHGIRRMNNNHDFVVALGTYYTDEVGARFLITLDTWVELFVTVGDIKADIHTEGTNRYILKNGNVVEFYIDSDIIAEGVTKRGGYKLL